MPAGRSERINGRASRRQCGSQYMNENTLIRENLHRPVESVGASYVQGTHSLEEQGMSVRR